jgi:lipopolysaccharide/colanic/teichoic acid biosynthesis glycosyltransferase
MRTQECRRDRGIRILNVIVAAVGIVVTLPLMVLIALAIKLTSPGPVLYRQTRVGHDRRRAAEGPWSVETRRPVEGRRCQDSGGRLFTMHKFRTMDWAKAEGDSPQVWATLDDPRITPVGAALRACRLDELPQLFDVLRGRMNVVGPRPEQPAIFRELKDRVEGYAHRQAVPPGITGWAQVNQAYDASVDDVRRKVGLDLEYIGRRSAGEDLKIMARTLPVMLGLQGTLRQPPFTNGPAQPQAAPPAYRLDAGSL